MQRIGIPCLVVSLALVVVAPAEAKRRPSPTIRLDKVKVEITIEDQIVTTHVEQTWRNTTGAPREVDVLVPVPRDAAVTEYTMTVGGEPLAARLLPVEEARAVYTETVRRLQDPALLKHVGDQALRARAFPVPAGETRALTLTYRQAVSSTGGLLRHAVIPVPDRPEYDRIGALEIRVVARTKSRLVALYSPTHTLDVQRHSEHAAAGTHRTERARAGEEVLVFAATSEADVGLSVLTHRAEGEDGTFLLLGAPTTEASDDVRAPRTVLFVFDRSGSMKGEKIEQVKGALRFCLHSLEPADRFNLITFNNEIAQVFEAPVPATPESVQKALAAASVLTAEQGTNIQGALESALGQVPDVGPTDVVFLTDGLPTVGERDPGRIVERTKTLNEERARIFTFGVGHDVNVTFLDRLALDAKGFPIAVRPNEDVEVAVSTFFRAITSPALTGISILAEGVTLHDVYPKDLPDLFRGSTLTVMGRYRGQGEGRLILEGKRGTETKRYAIPVRFAAEEPGAAFLPSLWAARRIGHLIDDVRALGPDEPPSSSAELIDEILRLAKRHGIVTEYTAFLLDLDTEDPVEIRRRAREAFQRAGQVHSGAWAQSQARNKEQMKRAGGGRQTTGYEDEQGRYIDLSDRVARLGSRVFLRDKEGLWIDTAVRKGAEPVVIRVGTEAYARLVASGREFAQVAALGAPILLAWEGRVLRIEDAEDAPEAPATPAR